MNINFNESISVNTVKWKDSKSITSVTTKVISSEPSWRVFFDDDCNYCDKCEHKKQNCLKKKSDNIESRTLSTGSASGSNCVTAVFETIVKSKLKKNAAFSAEQQLWLTVHLAGKSLLTVFDSTSDLNLLHKNIVKDLSFVFDVLSLHHAEEDILQTYFIYHKVVKVQDSFRVWKQICEPFPSVNLEMSVILRLS